MLNIDTLKLDDSHGEKGIYDIDVDVAGNGDGNAPYGFVYLKQEDVNGDHDWVVVPREKLADLISILEKVPV